MYKIGKLILEPVKIRLVCLARSLPGGWVQTLQETLFGANHGLDLFPALVSCYTPVSVAGRAVILAV